MIVERPPILLVLDAGHGEYMPPECVIWFNHAEEQMRDAARRELMKIGAASSDFEPYDWTFCAIIVVEGTLAELELQLTALIGEIGVEPSGDDDTFDYWPSGCRLALAFARDLDQIAPLPRPRTSLVEEAIRGVLASKPEFANELSDKIPALTD